MKLALLFVGLISSQLSWAMPYRCLSAETLDGKAIVNAKINGKRLVNGFEQYLIGVTPATGFRFSTYGSGQVDEASISLTLVDDHFIVGTISAEDKGEDGILEGEFKHSKLKRRPVPVRCFDLTKHSI